MVLRDDLGAARARIEALERELDAAREAGEVAASDAAERGRAALNEARARLRALEDLNRATDQRYENMRDAKRALDARVVELEAEVESLREQSRRARLERERVELGNDRRGSPGRDPQTEQPTVKAHNEAFAPLEPTGTMPGAGVRCTDCARAGRDVEVLQMPLGLVRGVCMTLCPVCGAVTGMRERGKGGLRR